MHLGLQQTFLLSNKRLISGYSKYLKFSASKSVNIKFHRSDKRESNPASDAYIETNLPLLLFNNFIIFCSAESS